MIAHPLWTMKLLILLCSVLLLAPSLPAQQNGIAQDSELITSPAGDKFLRWYGYEGRSYFLQVSEANDPLGKWNWAPIIESGNDEEISYEVDGTAPKSFFRLKYTVQVPGPNETLESADFDQDGISNIDEINPPAPLLASDATDPLDSDTDHDGMNDGWERTHGLDPNDDGPINPDNGPNGDPDGDLFTNLAEQAGGTDPQDSSSYPPGTPLPGGAPLLVSEQLTFSGTRWGDNGFQTPGRKYLKSVFHTVTTDPGNWGFAGDETTTVTTDVGTGDLDCSSTGAPATDFAILDPWTVGSDVSRSRSGTHPPYGATSTASQILSDEYTVPAFIANVESWFPAYQNRFTVADPWVPPYEYIAMFHTATAHISLSPDPADPIPAIYYQITKLQYKWKVNPAPNQIVHWLEVFTPADSSPPSAEAKSWTPSSTDTESPTYEIDPTTKNGKKNGTYSVHPVDITVIFGIGPSAPAINGVPGTSRHFLETYMESVKVVRLGDLWLVRGKDAIGAEKLYCIEVATTEEKLLAALSTAGMTVVFDGHANFGIGPNFSMSTLKSIDDFTNFGARSHAAIQQDFRGNGQEPDAMPYVGPNGLPLPNSPQTPQEFALIASWGNLHQEGWAYLIPAVEDGIKGDVENYSVPFLNLWRFENDQNKGPGETISKKGLGFNNEWHFTHTSEEVTDTYLIVKAPKDDVPTLRYSTFFYNACSSGVHFIENFKHGKFVYTKRTCTIVRGTSSFVRSLARGKTPEEATAILDGDDNIDSDPEFETYGIKAF